MAQIQISAARELCYWPGVHAAADWALKALTDYFVLMATDPSKRFKLNDFSQRAEEGPAEEQLFAQNVNLQGEEKRFQR